MRRRDLGPPLAAVAVMTVGMSDAVRAQAGPVEGRHYQRLATPLAPTADATSAGRIEVVEFFWYGCAHCKAFDPLLDVWQRERRDTVALRRVHVAGRAQVAAHQRLFFALESLGVEERLRPAVFDALITQRRSMNTPQEQAAALASLGIDPQGLTAACQSFAVAARCRQAAQQQERYGAESVPALFIGGRFRTSPAMAGVDGARSEEEAGRRALAVADHLIEQLRRG